MLDSIQQWKRYWKDREEVTYKKEDELVNGKSVGVVLEAVVQLLVHEPENRENVHEQPQEDGQAQTYESYHQVLSLFLVKGRIELLDPPHSQESYARVSYKQERV